MDVHAGFRAIVFLPMKKPTLSPTKQTINELRILYIAQRKELLNNLLHTLVLYIPPIAEKNSPPHTHRQKYEGLRIRW